MDVTESKMKGVELIGIWDDPLFFYFFVAKILFNRQLVASFLTFDFTLFFHVLVLSLPPNHHLSFLIYTLTKF